MTGPVADGSSGPLRYWPFSVGEAVHTCANDLGDGSTQNAFFASSNTSADNVFCKTDLQQVLTHEFGHTFSIAHPNSTIESVMLPPTRFNSTAQRNLYQADKDCVDTLNPQRSSFAYTRKLTSGSIGAEVVKLNGSFPYYTSSFASGTSSPGSGTSAQTWANGFNGSERWKKTGAPTQFVSAISQQETNFTTGWLPGYSNSEDRVFLVEKEDRPSTYDFDSSSRIRYVRSTNNFVGGDPSGPMKYCTPAAFGVPYCQFQFDMRTENPLSYTVNPGTAEPLFSWVHSNRQDEYDGQYDDHEVLLANDFKPGSGQTVNAPYSTGKLSSVGPGVACKDTTSGWDCIYAYVPMSDPSFGVKVVRFQVVNGVLTQASERSLSDATTANRISLAYQDGVFYAFLKYASAYPTIVAYKSTNGGFSWSLIESNLGYSIAGPTTAAYETGENYIGYTR